MGKLSGKYAGVLEGPTATTTWKPGVQEVTKIIPQARVGRSRHDSSHLLHFGPRFKLVHGTGTATPR